MSIRFTDWLSKKHDQPPSEADTIENIVLKAQAGDEEARNTLINQYQPFIKKTISKTSRKFIYDSMDEFSVGLLAFNEAIDQYREEEGYFLSFAKVVIQRRIIDYLRKEQRQNQKMVYQELADDEEYEETTFERDKSIAVHEEQEKQRDRMEDIKEYQKLLQDYRITFPMLTKQCPKHIDARENAKEIALLIYEDQELSSFLTTKKKLPIKQLEQMVRCSRKTIERNRTYIIALSLIYIGGFSTLQSYIVPERGRD